MIFNSFLHRAKNTITYGALQEKIFFLHIPKSAGTSINTAIRCCYQTIDVRNDRLLIRMDSRGAAKVESIFYGSDYTHGTANDFEMLRFSEEYLAYLMIRGYKYISGHICFNDVVHNNFQNEYKFITVLRDPVKRWISFYLFVRYREGDRLRTDLDVIDYLRTDLGKSQGSVYVKYLGGARKDSDYTSKHAIDNAKKNLHKFYMIGFIEHLDHFAKIFKHNFGKCLKIKKTNASPVSDLFRGKLITAEIVELIQDICKPDIEIHKYAQDIVRNGKSYL
ncbi:MAG: sulfotransferase family 2 domain-containing protein [Candidatus Brocadiaceae bacterium]|nr:sulfotransferase family 2 domain-containing protein [Candidatus Brocadiaceae bacterium]